ncbi:TPM domain-containing protein [Pedobacter polaris]|uniref:TPM domain-containing protein n=1 Tax=Pedobacter polaris TaxID=2571273 RepID=A0A4V5P157_9SPHI|nr:TPM domain-containing protein [Pedobacter polaris]TKC04603.1 TPM domain-containing protein [Pedobacter polaris]
MKKISLLIVFLAFSLFSVAQKFYAVDQIPNPKITGQDYFVSNPDGILSKVETINQLLVQLEQQTKIEFAVVVLRDFDESQEDFEFAKAIFDKWKIGKAGSNNGLLLLISIDRRKYRFISGSGVEGLLPDVVLKQIGENYLVPAFKEQLYDDGVTNAINEINDKLTNPQSRAEVQSLINQEKQQDFDWKFALGGSISLILIFYFVFRLVNKQAKKNNDLDKQSNSSTSSTANNKGPKTTNPKDDIKSIIKDKNGYEAVYIKGCACIFILIFISVFILIFVSGFGLFESLEVSHIPYILYVLLAIGLFFRYYAYIGNLRRKHFDDENFLEAVKEFHYKNWWLIVFSPLIIIALIIHAFKKVKTVERFKPIFDSRSMEMSRLDRDINLEGEPYLTKGQRKEELIKAYDYDIWESTDKKEHIIKVYPAEEYDSFVECPECKFRTYQLNKQVTTKAATYSSSGTAKLTNECNFCDHVEFIRWVTLAQLVKSSSSSSSSSGGSSSSSSSGSFGGGSSSGGGAGGSW